MGTPRSQRRQLIAFVEADGWLIKFLSPDSEFPRFATLSVCPSFSLLQNDSDRPALPFVAGFTLIQSDQSRFTSFARGMFDHGPLLFDYGQMRDVLTNRW